eukprot:5165573-Prorocentrum_lima.AAC.1
MIAVNSGPKYVDWLSEVRSNPERVYPLLCNYYKKTGRPLSNQRARRCAPKWSMVTYYEDVKTTTG